jgi:hypothetical protein
VPRPEPLNLLPAPWTVKAGMFCLDPKGYETESRNTAEVLRWVREASWQLDYYRGTAP